LNSFCLEFNQGSVQTFSNRGLVDLVTSLKLAVELQTLKLSFEGSEGITNLALSDVG